MAERLASLTINTIRTLAMDAVEAAQSGHPGTPMALAPVAYTLWHDVLRYDPLRPDWPNRDRFVLSAGHASMLLYAVLHLAGVRQLDAQGKVSDELAVRLDDIRRFRQWGSRCPGHPEYGHTSGVETTTGPLGQGVANSVGMAIAGRFLAARFNRPGFEVFNYRVYALASDGDMMEGISGEAASLAGHLRLGNLCWIYDANQITIDGSTDLAFTEDVPKRFAAYGWHTEEVADANDLAALVGCLARARSADDRPTLILVRSHIAWGAPHKQDTSEAHGAPLGADEVRATKRVYGWDDQAQFLVPDEVVTHFRARLAERGGKLASEWYALVERYAREHPELARQCELIAARRLPEGWDAELPEFPSDAKGDGSRNSSGKVLQAIACRVPWLLGGAADLAASTKTTLKFPEAGDQQAGQPGGRNLHFGIREHAMAAALNGLALCGLRPFGSTFLVFSDYMRPAMRLSALAGLPSIFVFTHDSIGVGEDGPTHQPVEHLAALRAIPNLLVMRPADANEVTECWRTIMPLVRQPAALVLTRQNLPTVDRRIHGAAAGVARGAYILKEPAGREPQVLLLASGSEVGLCLAAAEQLAGEGLAARVVSMPCWELFEAQDQAYRENVLPPGITARVGVEAGVEQGWSRYLGPRGCFLGMQGYGASAPYQEVYRQLGITVERIVSAAKALVAAG